jgi:hypothetical protein
MRHGETKAPWLDEFHRCPGEALPGKVRRQGKNVPAKSSAWLTRQKFVAIVMKAPAASSSLCPIRAAASPGSLIAWNVRKEGPQLQTGTFMETIPLVR